MKIAHPDHRRPPRRSRVLATVAVLPSLATLGNLVCGLGAVYMCLLSIHSGGADLAKATESSSQIRNFFPTYLAIGAYLVFAAMMFDGLDGRLARLARKTSEFGGQLDSLADVVSFGVAPAIIALCIVHPGEINALTFWQKVYWRCEWVMAAVYVCCAALRLARFNVENEEDESAHLGFRGLPSPGAAAALIGLVVLHQDMLLAGELRAPWGLALAAALMPPFAMILGLLMVSRFPYPHMVNTLLRGRRPFRQVVITLIAALIGAIVWFQMALAVAAAAYALSGPINRAIRRKALAPESEDTISRQPSDDLLDDSETFEDEPDDDAPVKPATQSQRRPAV